MQDQTIDSLVREKRIILGSQLKSQRKVYLDLNFWIRMRECFLEKPINSYYKNLYDFLLVKVRDGEFICPISQRIFIEMLRQEDFNSLLSTARVIDQLSLGTTILSEPEREQYELWCYVRKRILNQTNFSSVNEIVWAKIPYVFGIMFPENTNWTIEETQKIQTIFFNHSWEISLEEMIVHYKGKIPQNLLRNEKSVLAMNIGKRVSNKNIKSIQQLFDNELKGALSIYNDLVIDFYNHIKNNNHEVLESLTNRGFSEPSELLNQLYVDIKKGKIDLFLPSLVIQICIHTLMRWDKDRSFKPNDLDDFYHASSALPCFDYFLTDKPLSILLKSGPYNLCQKYGCVVEYDPGILLNQFRNH